MALRGASFPTRVLRPVQRVSAPRGPRVTAPLGNRPLATEVKHALLARQSYP